MNRVLPSCPPATEMWEHTALGLSLQSLLSREPHGILQVQASVSTTVWAAVRCDCTHLPKLAFLGQQVLYPHSLNRTPRGQSLGLGRVIKVG